MQQAMNGNNAAQPVAFFVGDFNVGKSALINALLRSPILYTGGEESRSLPTFLTPGAVTTDFTAFRAGARQSEEKTFEEFLSIRKRNGKPSPYSALAVRVAPPVFTRLSLVDTPGASSDSLELVRLEALPDQHEALMVVVTDIEYWFAKHTLDLIAYHADTFEDRVVVVANKADLLNASEILRIQEKAARRIREYGIPHPPRFFTLSARLESVRNGHEGDGRPVKPRVRTLCDAAFDQFRLCLYEFEAQCCAPPAPSPIKDLMTSPLVSAFLAQHQGATG